MKALLVALAIAFLAWLNPSSANTQVPKVFVDVDAISLIDPLKHGFQIVLKEHFLKHYLNPTKLPTIFISALSLRQDAQDKRIMLYREDIEGNTVVLSGLDAKSWYFVCVEFENVVRRHNRGNTSTVCQMVRTLDDFGKKMDGTINEMQLLRVDARSIDIQIAVDVDFLVEIMVYFESGLTPVQTFMLSQPKSFKVQFSDLTPGQSYGRVCIQERPYRRAYTMMGRDVYAKLQSCHFDNLVTEEEGSIQDPVPSYQALKTRTKASALNMSPAQKRSSPSASINFVFVFILSLSVPLALL